MQKLPETISLMEAAKAFKCRVGIIARAFDVVPRTGNEPIPTARVMRTFKCSAAFLADILAGEDVALNKQQAADLLGVKRHSLDIVNVKRATILPTTNLGNGPGQGFRYSRKAIKAHQAYEDSLPPPPMALKAARALESVV